MKNRTFFLLVVVMASVLTSCAGVSKRLSQPLSAPNLTYGDPGRVDAIISIKPTQTLSHLTNRYVDLDNITDMIYNAFLSDGNFKSVTLGGEKYDYAVSSTVIDLKDIFNNIVTLRMFIQKYGTQEIVYDYKFVGLSSFQSLAIFNIADVLKSKFSEIRASLYTELKSSPLMIAQKKDIGISPTYERTKQGPIAQEYRNDKPQAEIQKESIILPSRPMTFGRYYALVIGNDNYQSLPKLKTAHNDAKTISKILENDYGFNVKLLLDARRVDIITTLAYYREKLVKQDNLLIYYAGHGWLDKEGDEGYWLPVDSTKDNELNWVSNSSITSTLKAMAAKHVLIVADSCYSGKLARGLHITQRSGNYYSSIAQKRARSVISSGGLEPVIDSGGIGNHSIFAAAFLEALNENRELIDSAELFGKIRRPVMLNSDQTPEYSDIRKADHDGGEFIFVRMK